MTKTTYKKIGAIIMAGIVASNSSEAFAQVGTVGTGTTGTNANAGGGGGNSFNTIANNIVTSIGDLPGLLAALSYLFGILLGVLGVLKIKDHVENPSQTPLKDGAMRLAAGGALFALPIIYEAMTTTLNQGTVGAGATTAKLSKVGFNFAP